MTTILNGMRCRNRGVTNATLIITGVDGDLTVHCSACGQTWHSDGKPGDFGAA